MELKLREERAIDSSTSCLNRTFYGIETKDIEWKKNGLGRS